MSAGNAQRNSLAVFECQEELNNAIIPLSTTRRRADAPKIGLRTSRNTETLQPQYDKGSCAPFAYAHDGKRTWMPGFPARQEFTASRSRITRRMGREEGQILPKQHQHGHQHSREHTSRRSHSTGKGKREYPPSTTRRTRRNPTSEPQEAPNITATARERECRPAHVRPMIENGLEDSIYLPDNSLRHRRAMRSRLRRGVEGTDMARTTSPRPPTA